MRTLTGALFVASITLAGCGQPAEPANAQPVGAGQAGQAGNALSASAEESAGTFTEDGPAPAGFGGVACTVDATDDGVDADADTIPDNGASVVVTNCVAEERGGVMNASYSVSDTLVEAGQAQFPYNFLMEGAWDVAAEGPNGSGAVAVSRSVEIFSDADSIGAIDEASVEASLTGPNGGTFTSDEGRTWSSEYVQSTTSATFGDGTLVFDGEWNLEFEFANEAEDQEYRAYANGTVHTDGLEVRADCATHVVGGSLSAIYEAGETGGDDGIAAIVVTWSGCGASSTTFDVDATPPPSS